jgi:hypothetical protein
MDDEKASSIAVVMAFNAILVHRSLFSHVQPILHRLLGHITVSGMQAAKYGLTRVIPDIRDASTQVKAVAQEAAGTALEATVAKTGDYLDGLEAACSELREVMDAGKTGDIAAKLDAFAPLAAAASDINHATETVIDELGVSDAVANYTYRGR